VARNLKHTFI